MKTKKILIVDDHTLFRSGLKSLFEESEEYEIIAEASTGMEAIDKFEITKPDIILLDIGLKDIGGIDVAKKILEKNSDAKIILITMHYNENFVREAISLNIHGYVLKTDDINELFLAIEETINGKKYYSKEVQDLALANYQKIVSGELNEESGEVYLTKREKEIIQYIAQGLTYHEIADKLFISQYTVINHRQNIVHKLGLKSNTALVRYALKRGLVT